MTSTLRTCHLQVLAALDSAGVDYVVLRGSAGTGDQDLLIRPEHMNVLTATLAQLGIIPAPSEHHWPHRLFVGYMTPGDPSTHDNNPTTDMKGVHVVVDVLDRLVLRGLELGERHAVPQILAGRVRDADSVPRPSAPDAAWIETVSGLLRTPPRPLGSSLPALDPACAVGLAFDERYGGGTAARLAEWMTEGRSDAATAELRQLRARTLRPSERAARSVALWSGRLGRRSAADQSTGVRVVLLGPDGAGKSTLSQGLVKALPLPVHEIYMGVFRTDRFHRMSRYLPGVGLTTRLVRLAWRSTKGQWYARRGHVVVFDRYTYDAGLRPGARGFRSRVSYYMIERSVPDPDLVVVLDAPGAVMFERKHEHDIATLEQRRQWYIDIAATLDNAVIVDATQPPDAVLQQVVAAVWRTIRDR